MTEELLTAGERGIRSTVFAKIFVVAAPDRDWSDLPGVVGNLEAAAHAGDAARIHQILRGMSIGYANPFIGPADAEYASPKIDVVPRPSSTLLTAGNL